MESEQGGGWLGTEILPLEVVVSCAGSRPSFATY